MLNGVETQNITNFLGQNFNTILMGIKVYHKFSTKNFFPFFVFFRLSQINRVGLFEYREFEQTLQVGYLMNNWQPIRT